VLCGRPHALACCDALNVRAQRDLKLGKLSSDAYTQQALEILTALKKLGETVPTPRHSCIIVHHPAIGLNEDASVS